MSFARRKGEFPDYILEIFVLRHGLFHSYRGVAGSRFL